MKKVILFFFVAFMAISAISAQSAAKPTVAPVDSLQLFNDTYQKVLNLNSGRFADLDKIQIGDSVLFPALGGSGTKFLIADAPVNGVHDCLYRLTGKYIKGQLKTQPVIKKAKIKPIVLSVESSIDPGTNGVLVGLEILGLFFLAMLILYLILSGKRVNINQNPVVSGGLSNNPAEAAAQIAALTGTRVVKSEKGRLICASPMKVKMHFSNGVKKVPLISGEEYYRITEENGTIRYARRACGNLINGSISELPTGVTFIPGTAENSTWIAPVEEKKSTPELEELPIEIFYHLEIENDVIAKSFDVTEILKALDGMKNNVPSEIVLSNLKITIPQKRNAKKEKE